MNFTRIFRNEQIPFPLIYLNDLGRAVSLVDQKYCNWEAKHITVQKSERVFAYELYHQFRVLTINNEEYSNIQFNGEIGKQIFQRADDCGTGIDTHQLNFAPDLVLHKGQRDSLEQNQKLVIEIKARNISDDKLAKDILKLNHYIDALNFQYGIFITVNTDEQVIKEKLKRKFSREATLSRESNFKGLFILNYRNRIIAIDRLYNLIID